MASCYDVRADSDRGGEKELVGEEAGEGAEQAGEQADRGDVAQAGPVVAG